MTEFKPYFTADGSTGLYNSDFNDIYHSATGALTEAYEKFIYPINFEMINKKNEIKILDICYGIGYNSKSFLNYILDKKFLKNYFSDNKTSFATIYTDNIFKNFLKKIHINNNTCNETIYTDNILRKISITAVDNDEKLFFLSPFIKTGQRKISVPKNLPINSKFYNNSKQISKRKINKLINFLIFEKISSEIIQNKGVLSILSNENFKDYFETDLRGYVLNLVKEHCTNPKLSNLHNIYYRYLSKCYKMQLKRTNLDKVYFNYKIDDARSVVRDDKNEYNLIFLDAFSPNKCPCLWSYEFFTELYRILEKDGMLLTYSTSAVVRSAMIEAGFIVGNVYNERLNKFTGTVAVKNSELIKYPLTEFDFGLLKTRAGIFYRDKNLNGQNEAIIELYNLEKKNSIRESSTQYIKNYTHNKDLP